MSVNISRPQMLAFIALVRNKTFSAAAETLNITQAAFSIRIQRLEDELQHTLLVRNKSGITLTEAGRKFLTYCEMAEGLEEEFLTSFMMDDNKLRGNISIGAFSTIGRSVVLPSFTKFLRDNPEVGFNFTVKELGELPDLLISSEADFIFLDQPLRKEGIDSVLLGNEEYVHITSVSEENNTDIYLNHDEHDMVSFRYFDHLGMPVAELKRRYLDEIHSVIDGVASGWGVSILPEHLIKNDPRIKIINPRKKMASPVYVCYRTRSYYSRAFSLALDLIKKEIPKRLK